MRRRTFLSGTTLGLASLSLTAWPHTGLAEGEEGPANLEIIDCHTHFYDPSRPEGIPWPGKDSALYRTVLPKDLRALQQFRRVTGTVVVEASPRLDDNAWLLELATKDPFIVGVVGNLKPGDPDFANHLKRFAANPRFRGIRISVDLLQQLLEKGDLADLKRLADHDLSLDVNGGPNTPAVIAQLAPRLPALRIVLNHLGNVRITRDAPPADWRTGIQAAARHANVFCKISAVVEGAARDGQEAPRDLAFYRPYLDVVWRAFGDEHVIYGSNWPVSERAADYETLQRIALEYAFSHSETATRNFCSANSKRAYKWG